MIVPSQYQDNRKSRKFVYNLLYNLSVYPTGPYPVPSTKLSRTRCHVRGVGSG